MNRGDGSSCLIIEMEYEKEIQLDSVLHFLQPIIDTYRIECRDGKQYVYITVIA